MNNLSATLDTREALPLDDGRRFAILLGFTNFFAESAEVQAIFDSPDIHYVMRVMPRESKSDDYERFLIEGLEKLKRHDSNGHAVFFDINVIEGKEIVFGFYPKEADVEAVRRNLEISGFPLVVSDAGNRLIEKVGSSTVTSIGLGIPREYFENGKAARVIAESFIFADQFTLRKFNETYE